MGDFINFGEEEPVPEGVVAKRHGKISWKGVALALLAVGMVGSCASGGSEEPQGTRQDAKQDATVTTGKSPEANAKVVSLTDITATVEDGSWGPELTVNGSVSNNTDDAVHTSDMPSLTSGEYSITQIDIVDSDDDKYRYLREGAHGTFTYELTLGDDLSWELEADETAFAGIDEFRAEVTRAVDQYKADKTTEAEEEARKAEEEEARREEEEAARAAEEAARPKSTEELLDEKLDTAACWLAIEQYASQLYPYGFEPHWVLGKIAERAEDEDTWFFKYEVTITNAFGADYDTTFEAYVSGTTENPVVESLVVY